MEASSIFYYVFLPLLSAWFVGKMLHTRSINRVIRNIPGPPSPSFWTGNVRQFYSRHSGEYHKKVALNYGSVVKMQGLLGRDILYVYDAKALHTILIKEDHIFEESKTFIALNHTLFGPGLLSTIRERHRKERKMLNQVFSINHMRHMLPIFYRVVSTMRDTIVQQVQAGGREIDILVWCGRVALELIGQGGLGYSFDPLLSSQARNEYGDALKAVFPSLTGTQIYQPVLPHVYKLGPRWLRRWVVNMFPSSKVQKLKKLIDTMSDKSTEIIHHKRTALLKGEEAVVKQIGEGKDIMSVLMRANMLASQEDRLSEEELIAQVSTLVFAANDTTSNTLARILQLLADHQDMQDKLRQEILSAGAENEMPYDALNKLPLLDAVCRETLRCFPPLTLLSRVPLKDSVLPLSEPVKGIDGQMIHEIPIAAGTEVIIGALGSNVNKAMWGEDSLEWKPERWLSPLPNAVTEAAIPGVYSHLMSFMGGKRACIGFKFSEMEMKIVLSVLLSALKFEPVNKQIAWNIAGVMYPTVGQDNNTPGLPLKISMYKPSLL